MTDPETPSFAVAFPIAEAQRELLRLVMGTPLPTRYREGAENRPCASCGMTLNVGPRVLALGVPIYCPVCVRHLTASLGLDVCVEHLGNPEAGTEDPRPVPAPAPGKVS